RGTDGRIYTWGDEWDATRANTRESGIGTTTAVGSYPQGASPYRAEDMLGNVWEWVSGNVWEWRSTEIRIHDRHKNTQSLCMLRGGSWNSYQWVVRADHHDGNYPYVSSFDYGVRLVRGAINAD